MHPNLKAFLDMLAWAELGPSLLAESANGYNLLVGSIPGRPKFFYDYSDHPRTVVTLYNRKGKVVGHSSAAGRYQILMRYYDAYKKLLKLGGFWPEDQDAIAIRMIKEQGAYGAVRQGDIVAAIDAVKNIWASLPGAGYKQPEHNLTGLLIAYRAAGGIVA